MAAAALAHGRSRLPGWCDFASGSAAAIAGGVTTIGNMTFPWNGQSPRQAVARDLAAASGAAAVDYVLHPVMAGPSPEALAELPLLASAGHTSLKVFMTSREFETHPAEMIAAIRVAGQHGMLTLIHCEDGALVRFAGQQLLSSGRGRLADWADSRPEAAERAAVERAVAICEATGSPVYIVHLSSRSALRSARRGQRRGPRRPGSAASPHDRRPVDAVQRRLLGLRRARGLRVAPVHRQPR
jgi:dihydropyrimidinase